MIKSYTHDVWWSEDLDVKTGAPHHQVQLERLRLNGRLFLGQEPAAATLWFGGRQGSKSVRFESDEAGFFEGALPHIGNWRVDIELRESEQELVVYGAEVTSPGAGVAEVELRLGESRIAGEVQDADGLPVAGATVEASRQLGGASPTVTRTDDDGRFKMVGLAPGEILLSARIRNQSSQSQTLDLEQREPLLDIVLRLEEQQEINGQVNAAGVPVVGADVLAVPNDLSGHWALRGMGDRTGPAGEFSIELPDKVRSFDLAIFPPGYAATTQPFSADPSGSILVDVEALSGDLEITFREA
ncbi:MAG: carboxypeptidase-like regulatory domain-containing protein, partial [Acidobacteriota bacterium]